MKEYMNRKLDAYGQPLKFLKTYKIMTIIILALLGIGVLLSLFNISSWDLAFSVTILIVVTGFLSLVALPLLDKIAFFTTLSFISIFVIRTVYSAITTIIGAVSMPQAPIEGDAFSQTSAAVSNVITTTFSSILWITSAITIAMAVPLVLFAVQVIKHRQLFFTELGQLETEYVEEDTQAEEVQEAVAQ